MQRSSAQHAFDESVAPPATQGDYLRHRVAGYHGLLLVALLAVLHAMLNVPVGGTLSRALFVLQMGLFILWQPVVERQHRLSARNALWVMALVVLATLALDGWLLMFWVVLLAAVVGGKVLLVASSGLRLAYLLALGYLVSSLLLFAVPLAVPAARVPEAIAVAGRIGLPWLLGIMVVLARKPSRQVGAEVLDLVNSVFVLLLLATLVMGSLSVMLVTQTDYVSALLQALITLGGLLLLLGWLWNPQGGTSGMQATLSRYLLSLTLPTQQWLQTLADITSRESDPKQFLRAVFADMRARLSWLRGISWRITLGDDAPESLGQTEGACAVFRQQGIEICLYSRYALSPTVAWHINLLTQLLAEFLADKLRSADLRDLSYLKAVHETGARLTHDVKNLLQSLQTLVYAAEQTGDADIGAFRTLVRRQLPAIATRLTLTLDKLRVPAVDHPDSDVAADLWWRRVCQRYENESWITFEFAEPVRGASLPAALFSAVVDNLLANVVDKRAREAGLLASVSLQIVAGAPHLRVCDSGSPVPTRLVGDLLRRPVRSDNGLGIGLYQVARTAEVAGFRLTLESNLAGAVCFVLAALQGAPNRIQATADAAST